MKKPSSVAILRNAAANNGTAASAAGDCLQDACDQQANGRTFDLPLRLFDASYLAAVLAIQRVCGGRHRTRSDALHLRLDFARLLVTPLGFLF
jgi:hypothetical protein